MNTVAIIQARMSSTRLPGKVVKPLGSKIVLQRMIEAARATRGVDEAVIATSTDLSDDIIHAWCEGAQVPCYRGSLQDVLARYRGCAEAYRADTIIRITADCPVFDPEVCAKVIDLYRATGCDYASNVLVRSWPIGLDCEVFSLHTLKAAYENATQPAEREHVTPYIYHHPELFSLQNLPCPIDGLGKERWTLDTPQDYLFLQQIVAGLEYETPSHYQDILALLEKQPELRRINRADL